MVDYVGQKRIETTLLVVVLSTAFVAFIVGYWTESYRSTVRIFFSGVALCGVLCLPDWWFWRMHEVAFRAIDDDHPSRKKEKEDEDEDEEDDEEGGGFVRRMLRRFAAS